MFSKSNLTKQNLRPMLMVFGSIALMLVANVCFADTSIGGSGTTSPDNLGTIATGITSSFAAFGQLMIAVSYVAGIALCITAIFKFKQHRDAPSKIPLGTPISLLAIGIVLIFFPAIIKPAGSTLLGSSATDANVGGFTGQTGGLPGENQTPAG